MRYRIATRLSLLGLPLLAGALMANSPAASSQAALKPNIIIALLDDVSAKEFSFYNRGSTLNTPTLDRMARDGVKFQTAWAMPVCGPSRVALMTGRYATRTGHYDNGFFPARDYWLDHQPLGRLMRQAGYATGMFGKSHFSDDPKRDLGFDEYAIYRRWPGYDGPAQEPGATRGLYAMQYYWHPGIIQNGRGLSTSAVDFGPDLEGRLVAEFISRSRDRPYFLYWPFNLPHAERNSEVPVGQPGWFRYPEVPELNAQGQPTGRRRPRSLANCLEYADHLIGQLWAQVEASGQANNTVLIVMGDNGTAGYGKNRLESEVAPRVPLIVYGPGVIKRSGPTDVLADITDIFPTVLDLSGGKVAPGYEIDGHTFAPLLRGEEFSGREYVHCFLGSARWVRDRQWLRDGRGTLWFCGDHRDETKGYEDRSASEDPSTTTARARLEARLLSLPPMPLDDPEVGAKLRAYETRLRTGAAPGSMGPTEGN